MGNIFIGALFIAALCISTSAMAYRDYYKCVVTGFVETWGDVESTEYWLERFMEEEIFVNRRTGEVWHLGLGNTAYDKLELLHSGDSGNAFKVISRSNNGWNAHYMVVEEYAETDEKRFIIVEGGGTVWRGVCQ